MLTGQNAIVTGASSGIGAAIAQGLGYSGANVVVNYSGNPEGANEGVRKITDAGGKALAFKADVSSQRDLKAMVDKGSLFAEGATNQLIYRLKG